MQCALPLPQCTIANEHTHTQSLNTYNNILCIIIIFFFSVDKTKKKCTRAKKKKQSKKASKALQLQNASEKTSSKYEKIAIVYTSLYSTCKRVQNILLAMIFFIFILARISCTPLRTLCPFHCCPGSFLLWHNPNHNLALSVMDRNEMEIHTHTHTHCASEMKKGKKLSVDFVPVFIFQPFFIC